MSCCGLANRSIKQAANLYFQQVTQNEYSYGEVHGLPLR